MKIIDLITFGFVVAIIVAAAVVLPGVEFTPQPGGQQMAVALAPATIQTAIAIAIMVSFIALLVLALSKLI